MIAAAALQRLVLDTAYDTLNQDVMNKDKRAWHSPMLSRLYNKNDGKSLREVILDLTRDTSVGSEYASALLNKSIAVVNSDAPLNTEHMRLRQQSTQAEASKSFAADTFELSVVL